MIPEHYLAVIEPLEGVESMLELGNKRGTEHEPYKPFFEARGIRHVSVDLNGLDGALALDLRRPLNLGRFDMVTNIGTSEHVDQQEPVWKNIVDAALDVIVCITPAPGNWPGHGLFYPTEDFYMRLAALNGFTIKTLRKDGPKGRKLVYARLERAWWSRVDNPFLMPEASLLRAAPPR